MIFLLIHCSGQGTCNITTSSSNRGQLSLESTSSEKTLDHLLSSYASIMIEECRDVWISVEKERVWQRAIHFYKCAKSHPEKLSGQLAVEYVGQTGIDAGAIRGDFLEKMMTDLDRKLFEGNPYRRLPLKDRELEGMFEIAGMMQAHSVLQGSPSLSNLNPAVYAYLMTDSIEQSLTEPLQVEDIPLNAGTSDLIQLIQKVYTNLYCAGILKQKLVV